MQLLKAKKLAEQQIKEWGLDKLGWRFEWGNMKRAVGTCHYATKVIKLSRHYARLNDEADMLNTIKHEIAHALAGNKAGHGREWVVMAQLVGARPQRCAPSWVAAPARKFKGHCPNCKRVIQAHRRNRVACGVCCKGRFNPDYLIVWEGK